MIIQHYLFIQLPFFKSKHPENTGIIIFNLTFKYRQFDTKKMSDQ